MDLRKNSLIFFLFCEEKNITPNYKKKWQT